MKQQNDEKIRKQQEALQRDIFKNKGYEKMFDTTQRDKDGKKISLQDKLYTEQDQIDAINQQNLQSWTTGIVQKKQREEDRAQQNYNDDEMIKFEGEMDDPSQMRFGDPLKLINSTYLTSSKTQQDYRLITT